jgi:AcrR family transcriptional regulator
VGPEEVVRAAGLTRGALYHHFRDKEELFETVFEELAQEVVEQIAATALAHQDPYAALESGCDAWLDACRRPEVQRIMLIDAPSVLGWERWREIDQRYALGVMQMALQRAMDEGALEPQPAGPLSHLLIGALDEAGMLVAQADDVEATRAEMAAMLRRMLAGLRPPA